MTCLYLFVFFNTVQANYFWGIFRFWWKPVHGIGFVYIVKCLHIVQQHLFSPVLLVFYSLLMLFQPSHVHHWINGPSDSFHSGFSPVAWLTDQLVINDWRNNEMGYLYLNLALGFWAWFQEERCCQMWILLSLSVLTFYPTIISWVHHILKPTTQSHESSAFKPTCC